MKKHNLTNHRCTACGKRLALVDCYYCSGTGDFVLDGVSDKCPCCEGTQEIYQCEDMACIQYHWLFRKDELNELDRMEHER